MRLNLILQVVLIQHYSSCVVTILTLLCVCCLRHVLSYMDNELQLTLALICRLLPWLVQLSVTYFLCPLCSSTHAIQVHIRQPQYVLLHGMNSRNLFLLAKSTQSARLRVQHCPTDACCIYSMFTCQRRLKML